MAKDGRDADSLLVQVCIQCGKEYMFEEAEVPSDLTCAKCGSTVFRSFVAQSAADDVQDEYRGSTERDTSTTDPGTDVAPGDLHDLGNL